MSTIPPTTLQLVNLVRSTQRGAFIAGCPYPLLLGGKLLRPQGPSPTRVLDASDITQMRSLAEMSRPAPRPLPADDSLTLLPIVKTQIAFASMITVGRTANNDVVIPDVRVSKFHAWFRLVDQRIELSDAGSRNGTWIASTRLEPKGPPSPVSWGARLKFGGVELQLVDAATAWDRVNAASRA